MKKIEILRNKIDKIDFEIADLLNERAELVMEIGIVKKKLNINVIQLRREEEILERVKKRIKTLKSTSVEAIWREIFNACKLIQS